MKRLAAIINVATGETIDAPSHCPFCGQPLGDMIRHIMGAMFEFTCENSDCSKTAIVMNDHQKMR